MSAAAPQTSNPPARTAVANVTHGNKVAHGAFWVMVRRVTLVAACVDLAFLFLFLALGSPILAWLNVASVLTHCTAFWLSRTDRHVRAASLVLIAEITVHAIAATVVTTLTAVVFCMGILGRRDRFASPYATGVPAPEPPPWPSRRAIEPSGRPACGRTCPAGCGTRQEWPGTYRRKRLR